MSQSERPRTPIEITVNGRRHRLSIEPREFLLDVLRNRLHLTGAKRGCEMQICGACTVLLGGQAVSACSLLAVDADGGEVVTIEGLEQGGALHPVQQAFVDCTALQCGYCTPGMIMASVALLGENPDPSEDEIRAGLRGNICRCTGYEPIIAAVRRAAGHAEEGGDGHD